VCKDWICMMIITTFLENVDPLLGEILGAEELIVSWTWWLSLSNITYCTSDDHRPSTNKSAYVVDSKPYTFVLLNSSSKEVNGLVYLCALVWQHDKHVEVNYQVIGCELLSSYSTWEKVMHTCKWIFMIAY
jgi:hypothetical protein